MKHKILTMFTVLLFAFTFQTAFGQEGEQRNAMDDPAMKAWMEFATPGEPHKMMQGLVGTWNTTVKFMDPSGKPMETQGNSTYTSLMDGRYIQEVSEGNFMGMPFQGIGTYGYDNLQKKYVSTWVDNMGTGIMSSTGSSEDGGKTINWSGTSSDPMTGKVQNYRSTMKMVTSDQYNFEMFGPGPDGKEMKMMEITYNRKK